METIYLGAGCFWCVEAVYQRIKGVVSVSSGYMGGTVKNPCYREVCSGQTGHAEVVQVVFDPEVIDLEVILDIFWKIHDPTTLNRQGADIGTQYRSVIFCQSENQLEIALRSKEEKRNHWWHGKVVTTIEKASVFYKAEEYHQNYYNNNPGQDYCEYTIPPKLDKLKRGFSHLLK